MTSSGTTSTATCGLHDFSASLLVTEVESICVTIYENKICKKTVKSFLLVLSFVNLCVRLEI